MVSMSIFDGLSDWGGVGWKVPTEIPPLLSVANPAGGATGLPSLQQEKKHVYG